MGPIGHRVSISLFFLCLSDDIRKHSIGNDGFLSALAFGYGDDD